MKTKTAAILAVLMLTLVWTTAYAQDPTPTPSWRDRARDTIDENVKEQDALATPTPLPPTPTPIPAVPTQVVPPTGQVEREGGPEEPRRPAEVEPRQPQREEQAAEQPGIVGWITRFLGRKVVDPAGEFVSGFIARFKWILIAIGILIVIGILSYVFRGVQWLVWALSQLRHVWTLLRWLAAAGGGLANFISEVRASRTAVEEELRDAEMGFEEWRQTRRPPPPGDDEPEEVDVPWTPPWRRPQTGVIDESDIPEILRRGADEEEDEGAPPGDFSRVEDDHYWQLRNDAWTHAEAVSHILSLRAQTPDETEEPRVSLWGVIEDALRDRREENDEDDGKPSLWDVISRGG